MATASLALMTRSRSFPLKRACKRRQVPTEDHPCSLDMGKHLRCSSRATALWVDPNHMGFLRAVLAAVLAMAMVLPRPPREVVTAPALAMVRRAGGTVHLTAVPAARVVAMAPLPAEAGPLHVVVVLTVAMVVPRQLVVLVAGVATRLAR